MDDLTPFSGYAEINPVNPGNPAALGYPATLPVEVAMRSAPIEAICRAYNLSRDEWDILRRDPLFVSDVKAAVVMLREEGMSFKLKARLQSEELLKKSWHMIHDETTPAGVKADLLKFTVRCAGLEPKPVTEGMGAQASNSLQIQINLG